MGKRVLFIGDSITDGNRYKEKSQRWDLNHQIGHSYVYPICSKLGCEYPNKNLEFINRGVSGNRLIDIYSRLEKDILPVDADIVSILAGVNDGPSENNSFIATSPKKFEKVYRMLLDEILEKNTDAKLILMEPFFLMIESRRNDFMGWEEVIWGYQEIVKKISSEYNTIFVSLQEEFDKAAKNREKEYWIWDCVHPTESGHGLIAKKWLECSSKLVLG